MANRRIRLAIIGDGPLLAELRHLAGQLGIDALTWFAGSMSDVPAALGALDVFVLPSLMEGTSNAILEAMAAGLPVLATARGGNVELVQEGVSGHLFEPKDVDALATLMRRYAVDESARQSHGQAARAIAVRDFSLQTMLSRYQSVYDAVLSRP